MTSSSHVLLSAALVFGICHFGTAGEALAQASGTADLGVRTMSYVNSVPSGTPPTGAWSPNGRLLTYLATDSQTGKPGDLIQVDAATGHTSVLATAQQLSVLGSDQISDSL